MPANNIDVVLRLLNSRRFQSQLHAAGGSVRSMAGEFESASNAASGLTSAANSASGALYAIGAATRAVAYGVGALTVATLGMGVQFNATMESNTLAFEKFTGGAKQARNFTMDLFAIASETPFAFTDITTAGRRLLAFGYDAQETTELLKILGDTLAYTGGGADEIYRITKAFGDIRAKGRLMQQELNQLSNVGIPIVPMMTEELNLNEKQLRNIGRAGIDADTAIAAMTRGLKKMYGGGAKKYMDTFNGQWQRLKDNISLASGTATGPATGIFSFLKNGLRALNDSAEDVNKFLSSKKFSKAADTVFGAVGDAFTFLVDKVKVFLDALAPMKPFWDNVLWPFIKGLAKGLAVTISVAFGIVTGIIKVFAKILGWLGRKLEPLAPVFEGLGNVASWLFGGVILKGIGLLSKFGGVFGIVGRAAQFLAIPVRAVGHIFGWLGGGIIKILGFFGRLIGRIPGLGSAIKGLGGFFKNLGSAMVSYIKIGIMKVLGLFGNFGRKVYQFGGQLAKMFVRGLGNIGKKILGAFGTAFAFFGEIGRGIADWINDKTIMGDHVKLPGPLPDFDMPALAGGGTLTAGGWALVGEQGPEIVRMPAGASVVPNRAATARSGYQQPVNVSGGGKVFEANDRPMQVDVFLDRYKVGQAMGNYVSGRLARH